MLIVARGGVQYLEPYRDTALAVPHACNVDICMCGCVCVWILERCVCDQRLTARRKLPVLLLHFPRWAAWLKGVLVITESISFLFLYSWAGNLPRYSRNFAIADLVI